MFCKEISQYLSNIHADIVHILAVKYNDNSTEQFHAHYTTKQEQSAS